MKALVLEAFNQLAYKEMPVPTPAVDEVLIRVKACGICGSDIHGMDGSSGRRNPPLIMGHEASGTIEKLGEQVSDWTVGQAVTFDSTICCGSCAYCYSGRCNLCDQREVVGVAPKEYSRAGAFAEFVAVPARILYAIPDGVSFEHAAMVEPVSVAVHAVNRLPHGIDDSVVVVGAGMIGLFVIQVLRASGFGKIIAVDLDPARLELACQLGADMAVVATEADCLEQIRAATAGRGVDSALEVVGRTETIDLAMKSVKKGGSVCLVGNLAPSIEFPLQLAVTGELNLFGSCASAGEYPAVLSMLERGSVVVDPIISEVAPLSDGAQWFDRLYSGKEALMKVILKP